MHPRLEAELSNDEPKCVNCKYWDRFRAVAMHGVCDLPNIIAKCALPQTESGTIIDNGFPFYVITQELSVCSAWEGK